MSIKYVLGLSFGFFFFLTSSSQAISLSFSEVEYDVNLHDSFTTDLVISDLGMGDVPSLGTFDIDIIFDPTILNLTGVTFGNQLDILGLGSIQDTIQSPGSVNIYELSLDFPFDLDFLQNERFTISTFSFDGVVTGSSSIDISTNYLGDSLGSPLPVDSIVGATVNVAAPVPEPATLFLFSTGLLGIGFLRKKRR